MRQLVLNAANELRAMEEAQALTEAATNDITDNALNVGAKESLSIVVLHPAILRSSQVFSELLQGIQAGADAYQLQLRLAVKTPTSSDNHITRLYFSDPTLRPNGVLIIGARLHEPLIDETRQRGIPYVLVGRQSIDSGVAAVGRDEEAVACEVTNYLIGLGHRAIAFVGGDEAYSYTHSRLRGYRRALQEQGIDAPEEWVALGQGREASEKILANPPEVTAVIFINDAYAMDGLPVFQAAGRVIPDDLSVISFDDTQEARTFDPPLTSVSYPRFQEGLWSVKALVEHIRHTSIKSFQVVFHASLIKRDSCAPPKQ
jgi:DNA-binding LacI/PurR family transcriptional regulator